MCIWISWYDSSDTDTHRYNEDQHFLKKILEEADKSARPSIKKFSLRDRDFFFPRYVVHFYPDDFPDTKCRGRWKFESSYLPISVSMIPYLDHKKIITHFKMTGNDDSISETHFRFISKNNFINRNLIIDQIWNSIIVSRSYVFWFSRSSC